MSPCWSFLDDQREKNTSLKFQGLEGHCTRSPALPLMVTVTFSLYIIYLAVPGLSYSMWDLVP